MVHLHYGNLGDLAKFCLLVETVAEQVGDLSMMRMARPLILFWYEVVLIFVRVLGVYWMILQLVMPLRTFDPTWIFFSDWVLVLRPALLLCQKLPRLKFPLSIQQESAATGDE